MPRTPKQLWQANGTRRATSVRRQKARSLVCHICHQDISLKYVTPHPLSFELDHVVALDNGGSAFDSRNHSSSHRRCNRAKSNHSEVLPVRGMPKYGTVKCPWSRDWLGLGPNW